MSSMRLRWLLSGMALGAALRRLSVRAGVSDEEAFGALPGDDVLAHPMVEWTRGLTVSATPDRIWPWLVQRGYGRAGWYTPRWVDAVIEPTLFRTRVPDRPRGARIERQHQELSAGDIIADGPDHGAYFRVREVEPERAIVYHSIRHPWRAHPVDPGDPEALEALEAQLRAGGIYLDFSWSFVLRPVAPGRTRLLVRTRADYAPRALAPTLPIAGLFDATYGRAMLRAIARRAEQTRTAGEGGPVDPASLSSDSRG